MRLRCLKLIRYGHFTNFFLDFGVRAKNGSDFHIIFGENEAGKSTAINGFFELLFGIHNQSKYGFQHSYDNLRLGAIIESENRTDEFSRIKGRRDTLRDADDKPISEDILTSALYGLSGVSYSTMFCLSEEVLEKGGEEILASKGDVGRLLFTGTAGLANFSKVFEELQSQANQVYKEGRSSSSEFSSLKKQLDQLDDERKSLDIQVIAYKQLENTLQRTEEAYQQARIKRDDIHGEHSQLKSLKNALPIRRELLQLEKELENIADLPDLPIGWVEEVIRLQQEKDTAHKAQEEAQNDINNANQQLATLEIDPIVNIQEVFKNVEILKMHFEGAEEELPQLHGDLHDIETDLTVIQQKLGVDEFCKLGEFVISEDTISYLEELLDEELLLKQSLNTAEQELSHAKDTLQQALNEKESTTAPTEKALELEVLFNSYNDKKWDPQLLLNNIKKNLFLKGLDIDEGIENLIPWRGTTQEIKDLEFPTISQAGNWSEKTMELEKELKNLKQEQGRLKLSQTSFIATMKSLSSYNNEIYDASAKNSHEERDKAWYEHRKRLDATSADVFEKALVNDDNIRDKRLTAAAQLSSFRAAEEELAKTEGILEVIADNIRRTEKKLEELRDELCPVLSNAKLPDDFKAEALLEWLKELQRVRKLIKEEDVYHSELNQAENEVNRQRTVLRQALKNTGAEPTVDLGLEELHAVAKNYLVGVSEERKKHDSMKKTLSMAKIEEQRRNKIVELLNTQLEEWTNKWNQSLEQCWLKEKNACQVRVLLGLFKNLASKLADRKKFSQKISKKEADQKSFFKAVADLVQSLDMKEQDNKMIQFSNLQLRLSKAQEIEKVRISTNTDFKQGKKQLEKAEKILSSIENRVQEMAAYFSILEEEVTLDRVAIALKQAQKKNEKVNSISEKKLSLFGHLGVESQVDADEMLANITLSEIERRLTEIEGTLKEAEENFIKRVEERRDALREIEKIGGDAGVALLNEERQGILLEILKKTKRAFALHLGLMAAEHALTTYREVHRSEFLKQTADAFKVITGGSFSSLTTQSDQAGDRLIAIRSNGRSIAAEEMSKGTRHQLYLALRLAAYRRFCNEGRSLPFIGDDIMETFDECRAESAIRQLSELAKHGQVLYFTHHRHICEIAKKVCGDGVVIHEIPKQRLG